jgi:tetratricopeptide (TPR) repeat protein
MARIFLSYARDDRDRAERIARSLEDGGHEVWWDRRIAAGDSFSSQIDSELAAAELVVVLWSSHSIRSDWVRDEAAAGRDSGRLVPVLIDRVDPPLGFRQYQSLSLVGRSAGYSPLLDAIAGKLGKAPRPAEKELARKRLSRPLVLTVAIVAILGLLASAWWLIRPGGAADSIAIVAAGDDAPSRDLARALTRELGQIRTGPLGQFSLVADGTASADAAYRVDVAASASDGQLQADVALNQRGASGLLWSAVIEQAGGGQSDLRQQVAAQIGDALICLAEIKAYRDQIEAEALALYLSGCANEDQSKAIGSLQTLTERAPKFGPGWAKLAMTSALGVPLAVEADRRSLIRQAQIALERAQKLAPDFPATSVADALMSPSGGRKIVRALGLIDKALEAHPNSPLLRGARTDLLMTLGRMREAMAESERAFEINPLSPALFDSRVSTLAYGGRPEAGFAELARAERHWPGSKLIADTRFRLELRFGDSRRALAYLLRNNSDSGSSQYQALRAYLEARSDPRPEKIDAALDYLRQRYRRDSADVVIYLQALVTFGRMEEAFKVVEPDVAADSLSNATDVLFRPYMARFRADRRFMVLAKRMGLVEAWQRTGTWPDFCSEPGIAYDCKAEAAKLTHVRDVTEAGAKLP